jgi:NAD+ synthase (glutamine-hydrolysing)
MKIAIAQISSFLGDFEKNIEKHIEYCKKAIAGKCDIIVFPELSLTGYSLKDINFEIAVNPADSAKFDKLKKISKEISIICGFVEEDENYNVFNSAVYISGGEIQKLQRKIYPPTYGIFEEFRYFSKGKDLHAFDTKSGKAGMLICEDMWHISMPYVLALDGAKIIFGIAASPTRLGFDKDKFRNYEINSEQHRTFARLLSVYFVFCNRVGYEDGVNFWGGSEVVDPFGNVVQKGKIIDEDLIFTDIDLVEVQRARRQARHFLDEDKDFMIKSLSNLK